MSDSSNSLPPITKILWGALTMSQVIYGVVATVVPVDEGTEADDVFVIALLIAGLMSLGMAIFGIPKFMKVASKAEVLTPFIIQWAIVESVAIYGVVGHFMGASDVFVYGMICMGIAFMVFLFPTERRAEEFITEKPYSGE